MIKMTQLSNEELASIAHDYYLSKLNIADISQKYNLSRYLITKALDDAEERGIVKISIQQHTKRNEELERQMQNRFHLKEVFILENLPTKNQDSEAIVNFAAKQIQNYAQTAKNIGMTWGTLMLDVINEFTDEDRDDLTFVQLLGQTLNSKKRKTSLVQEASNKFNSRSISLPAPLYALNSDFIHALEKEPFYHELHSYYKNLDLIFSGIGTFQSIQVDKFLMKNYAPTLFKGIDPKQIAGLIFGRPYDIEGNFYQEVGKHVCGINLDEIMQTPTRFVIVKNRFKTDALLGALRTGVITHLVTNSAIAEQVLEKSK